MTPAERKRKILALQQQRTRSSRQDTAQRMQQRNALMADRAGVDPSGGDTEGANRIAERDMARAQLGRGQAGLASFTSGATLGFNDEIAGALFGEEARDAARREQELARTAYPGQSTGLEIAGAVTTGLAAPAATTIRGATAVGAGLSAVDAAGRAEGTGFERLDDAAKGAAAGAFFSGLTSLALKGGNAALRGVFQRAEKRPTIQSLQAAKNAAYSQVRKAGVNFTPDDMTSSYGRLQRLAKTARFDLDPVSEVDKGAFDALRTMQRRADLGRPISLNNLDKTRQKLWDNYGKTDHPFVLAAIEEIDGLIASKAQGNEIMTAARVANSKYAKAKLLEKAFNQAELDTAATGSGGNILNKYRQAVNSILKKPREAKWFTPEERALMESFIRGDVKENVLRRAGKLAPGGNGLMTALNVYAASVDPAMLAITGAASVAKGAADRSAMRGSEGLLDAVSTGVIHSPRPQMNLTPAAVGASAGQSRF